MTTKIRVAKLVDTSTRRAPATYRIVLADYARPVGRRGGPAVTMYGPRYESRAEATAAAVAVWALCSVASLGVAQ